MVNFSYNQNNYSHILVCHVKIAIKNALNYFCRYIFFFGGIASNKFKDLHVHYKHKKNNIITQ